MNVKEMLVNDISIQQGALSTKLRKDKLGNILDSIGNGKYKSEVVKLREYLKVGDIARYSKEKKELDAVTFSGVFENRRKASCISLYNEVCVIDIDHINDDKMTYIFNCLKNDPFIFAFWKSPSGNGYKGLAKIKYLDEAPREFDYEKHKYAFLNIHNYFVTTYDIEIDPSGSDISRLCFLSWDEGIVIKECVEEYSVKFCFIPKTTTNEKTEVNKRISRAIGSSFNKSIYLNLKGRNVNIDRYKMQKILRFLRKNDISITYDYERWYHVAYSIANTFTYDIGEKYFLALCRLDRSKHNEERSIQLLQYCYCNSREEISFSTIVFYYLKAKENRGV